MFDGVDVGEEVEWGWRGVFIGNGERMVGEMENSVEVNE